MTRCLNRLVTNILAVWCITALYCTSDVHAASFECAKAGSFVEKAICERADLSRLDDVLAELYKMVLLDSSAPAQKTFRIDQLRWLESRNTCSNSNCIQDAYETRLSELSGGSKCHLTRCNKFVDTGANEQLWVSTQNDDVAGVMVALKKGADSNVCGSDYRRPLHVAVLNRNSLVVRELLKTKANPNVHDCPGDTPLIFAASRNDVSVAAQLLAAGANIEAGLDNDPLRMAAYHGHVEVLRILLSHKANPNAVHGDNSALIFASRNRHVEVVQLLLESGAKANYRTKNDGTALFEALGNFRPIPFASDDEARKALEIVRLLIKHGADVNARTAGWSPLQYARAIKATAIADLLASVGAMP